jgi:aspartate racemase
VRRLGILGGMGWPSTADAYRMLNEEIGRRLGGDHSADLLIRSFDFAVVHRMQEEDRWDDAGALLAHAAGELERAGADGLILCTNTMHLVADRITDAVSIPLLHIGDATARAVTAAGVNRVGLIATRFTMELDFYRNRLEASGIDVTVPSAPDREAIQRIIFDELVKGRILASSRSRLAEIAAGLLEDGARGIIAGCTEIELALRPEDVRAPFFPTTHIQVTDAVEWMLGA